MTDLQEFLDGDDGVWHDRFGLWTQGKRDTAWLAEKLVAAGVTLATTLTPEERAYIANCIPWERGDLREKVRAGVTLDPAGHVHDEDCPGCAGVILDPRPAHEWTTDDKHDYEWCRICLLVRQANGSSDAKGCKGPAHVRPRPARPDPDAALDVHALMRAADKAASIYHPNIQRWHWAKVVAREYAAGVTLDPRPDVALEACGAVADWGAVCPSAPGHPGDHDWRRPAPDTSLREAAIKLMYQRMGDRKSNEVLSRLRSTIDAEVRDRTALLDAEIVRLESVVQSYVMAEHDPRPAPDTALTPDRLAAAMNDAQIGSTEIALGRDLRAVAVRILAALEADQPAVNIAPHACNPTQCPKHREADR